MKKPRLYEIGGVLKTAREWAEERQMPYDRVATRLSRGLTIEQALVPLTKHGGARRLSHITTDDLAIDPRDQRIEDAIVELRKKVIVQP